MDENVSKYFSELGKKSQAKLTPEERVRRAKKAWSSVTKEERSRRAKKAWETKRAKANRNN